jgi:hypothetical protein
LKQQEHRIRKSDEMVAGGGIYLQVVIFFGKGNRFGLENEMISKWHIC